jgi:chemotaxis protein MotB
VIIGDDVELAVTGDQINIQIDGRLLFESGSARLKDEATVIFANLGLVFREYAHYRAASLGHTVDIDIQAEQFPFNWELSAVRATTVLRFFIRQGVDPERMTATGYADFLPLVDNTTPENRARNRRVEFVLEKQ